MKHNPLPTWRTVLGGYLKARAIAWIREQAYRRAEWTPPPLPAPPLLASYVHLYEQRGGVQWPHYCRVSSHHNVTTANGDPVCCCGYDPIADMHVPRPRNTMEADRLVRSHVNQHGASQ